MTDMVKKRISISTRSVWSVCWLIVFSGFTYLQFVGYIIPELQMFFRLEPEEISLSHIRLIWPPVICYLLVASNVCLAVRILKPLKAWNKEDGLIDRLISGFFLGVAMGLVFGFTLAVALGTISELTAAFTFGLTIGLISGLIDGLIRGFKAEFA